MASDPVEVSRADLGNLKPSYTPIGDEIGQGRGNESGMAV
jgi:hypothetical protein